MLSNGRSYLAIPGPSVTPDRVLNAMHRAAPNIYTGELIDMTYSLLPDLRAVARTDHHVAIYIANGHGAWEAALSNVVSAGDTVLVLATGRFGHGWGEMADGLGPLTLNIADPAQRSHAVTSICIGSPDGDRLRAWMEDVTGVTLGIGLGREPTDAYFRIGHMGHVNAHMVLGVLGSLDAGLKALNIPHGDGALQSAANVVASASLTP
ncbi:MAG: aspartate aminotransferase-like enzyme [Paracoccaceae bacterium]|jgi:aspartate aminotransferase-like enzyme